MKYRRILISSSEANVRRAIRRGIESGLYPLIVDETAEAVPSGNQRYDVVVFDIDQAGGLQSLTTLLSDRSNLQVLVLASRSHLDDALRAVQLGAADVLEKPATPQEIAAAMDRTLTRRSGLLRRIFSVHPGAKTSSRPDRPADSPPTDLLEGQSGGVENQAEAAEAVEPGPSYLECLDRARSAMSLHDDVAARRWIRTGLSIDTERPEAYNLLGILSEMEQDVSQAMKYFRAAVALDPMYEPPRNNLHRITGLRESAKRDLGLTSGERNGKHE